MGIFSKKKEGSVGEIELDDVDIVKYRPLCPHCGKGLLIIDRFLMNDNEDAVYSCPFCHKIIGISGR